MGFAETAANKNKKIGKKLLIIFWFWLCCKVNDTTSFDNKNDNPIYAIGCWIIFS